MENSVRLSVIIPSWKDPLLVKTIDSLLENSGLKNELEVIAVLDGYWPTFELREDPRVRYVHLGKNGGMRNAINAGVRVATGKYIMRTDEHCIFGKNYDVIMTRQCHPNWIMTARRFFLDPVKWEVMKDEPYVDYEKLVIQGGVKFAGQKWHSRKRERADISVDETMAMQGSMWLMRKKWWERVIGELQTEGYGPLYQDSHEMVFKTWKAGGKLMLTKDTWFAHKHRKFSRTHNYGKAEAMPGWTYSVNTWREYYEKEIKPAWQI